MIRIFLSTLLSVFAFTFVLCQTQSDQVSVSIKQDISSFSDKENPSISIEITNHSNESFQKVLLNCSHSKMTGELISKIENIETLDPNGNNILDPNETWISRQVLSNNDLSSIFGAGLEVENEANNYVAADAIVIKKAGVNVEIQTEQTVAKPGDIIDVNLIVRLLINEEAAKTPGQMVVTQSGVEVLVDLQKSRWELRNPMMKIAGFNADEFFSLNDIPQDLELVAFCDQAYSDSGRVQNGVLDESDPVNTVKQNSFCENPEAGADCSFPDWNFCMSIQIPEDYDKETYTLSVTDRFNVFMAKETKGGSGTFSEFVQLPAELYAGTTDIESIQILQRNGDDLLDQISLSPNPFNDQLRFEGPGNLWIEIFDGAGKLHLALRSDQLADKSLSSLPSGYYTAIIKKQESGQILQQKKLIKVK